MPLLLTIWFKQGGGEGYCYRTPWSRLTWTPTSPPRKTIHSSGGSHRSCCWSGTTVQELIQDPQGQCRSSRAIWLYSPVVKAFPGTRGVLGSGPGFQDMHFCEPSCLLSSPGIFEYMAGRHYGKRGSEITERFGNAAQAGSCTRN